MNRRRQNIGPLPKNHHFFTRSKQERINPPQLTRGKWPRHRKNIGPVTKHGRFLSDAVIMRDWRASNLERARANWRKWRTDHPRYWIQLGNRYSRLKQQSKRRGLKFDLTLEQYKRLVEGQPCRYCGASLDDKAGWSLDRVDNLQGYNSTNCVPCCYLCNSMKMACTVEQFYAHIKRILAYSGESDE